MKNVTHGAYKSKLCTDVSKYNTSKVIAYIIPDSVSRLRTVGLYHDLDFKDGQQELGTPFEPLSPVEQSTHTPIEVQEILLHPVQIYDTQNTLPVTQPKKHILKISHVWNKNEMSLPELTPEKIIQLQKMTHSAITQNITCTAIQMKITSQMPWTYYTKKSYILTVPIHQWSYQKNALNTYYTLLMIP